MLPLLTDYIYPLCMKHLCKYRDSRVTLVSTETKNLSYVLCTLDELLKVMVTSFTLLIAKNEAMI